MMRIVRRWFGLSITVTAALSAPAQPGNMTAREVVARIQKRDGVEWKTDTTVDTFKAGNPDSRVTGIAVTPTMATMLNTDAISRRRMTFSDFAEVWFVVVAAAS